MTYFLIEFINQVLPQLTVLAVGWVGRELYRTSRQIETNEKLAQKNRQLILGLHDLNDPADAIREIERDESHA